MVERRVPCLNSSWFPSPPCESSSALDRTTQSRSSPCGNSSPCSSGNGRAPRLSPLDRLFWTSLRCVWSRWAAVLVVVKPQTVVGWHRKGFRLFWRWRSRDRGGRPKTTAEIRALIRRLAQENPSWGAPKIYGELQKLSFVISERTVARYLRCIRRRGRSVQKLDRGPKLLFSRELRPTFQAVEIGDFGRSDGRLTPNVARSDSSKVRPPSLSPAGSTNGASGHPVLLPPPVTLAYGPQ